MDGNVCSYYALCVQICLNDELEQPRHKVNWHNSEWSMCARPFIAQSQNAVAKFCPH